MNIRSINRRFLRVRGRSVFIAAASAAAAVFIAPCVPADAIADGHPAASGEVPSVVQITGTLEGACSGTIVDASTIVTAAHCLMGADESTLGIRYGSTISGAGTPVAAVATVHEQFNLVVGAYDIAVLRPAHPIPFDANVQPADLPPQNHDPVPGTVGVIAGWGATQITSLPSPTLQVGDAVVAARHHCLVTSPVRVLIGDIVCLSGASASSPCQGDSGGPLLYTAPGATRPTLIGITSSGLPCGLNASTPAAYTRVGYFTTWIQTHKQP
ncbi:S1 family serine peptidase [Nocardia sp. NPDC052566]|uniref:S1 family serine peptidase n=1 Tax=Nocardia sp. NPDC052566 TaxID=3364330 RepID=UPI0037C9944E